MRTCSGADVAALLVILADWFANYVEHLNALNVYPVPDGDTGTNMAGTLRAAAQAVSGSNSSLAETVQAASRGALMGASGNSGVILSQMLRGFSEACETATSLDAPTLQRSLRCAAEAGYRAVSEPVEGTMLTVARRAAEAASGANGSTTAVLGAAVQAATLAVAETPLQLDRLRKAGAVDAGGEGVRLLLEGCLRWVNDEPLVVPVRAAAASHALVAAQPIGVGVGFCTQFLVERPGLPAAELRQHLEQLGGSVIIVEHPDLVRVHLHTEQPEKALDFAADLGVLSGVSVEDMALQHQHGPLTTAEAVSDIGIVAVAQTEEMAALLRSLGAARIVEPAGGGSPSIEEILHAVQSVGYATLIAFTNDPNAAMAAEQARELTPRSLRIVSTRNVAETVGGLLAFSFESGLDDNLSRMQNAVNRTASLEVANASRSARIDGNEVAPGDAVVFIGAQPALADPELNTAVLHGLDRLNPADHELATLYRGPGMETSALESLVETIRQHHPTLEIETADAGPPHRLCVLGLE